MNDQFTQWIIAVPIIKSDTTTIVSAVMDHLVLKFGTPRRILTDNGNNLVSDIATAFYERIKV